MGPDGRWAAPWSGRRDRWLAVWVLASALAVGTKLTAGPVVLGTALALLWRYRRWVVWRLGQATLYVLAGGAAALGVGVYVYLLSQPPSTSRWASLAHFWPITLLRALPAYVRGGLADSFGTFWYAYDYGVRWPARAALLLAGVGATLLLGAGIGLIWGAVSPRGCGRLRAGGRPGLVLWLAAGMQIVSVVARFGFGSVLQVEMGGVAQAKGFFPALLPLALLFTGGWAALYRVLGGRDDRWLTLLLLGAFLLMDWASLAVTLWHHYRWLQAGL